MLCKGRKKDLDSWPIPEDIVSDKELFAVWGPKCSDHGFNYKRKKGWAKEIEDVYLMVYGLNKIPNNTICQSFARSFLAHKKGYYANWAELRAKLERYRVSRWGRRNPPSTKPRHTQLRRNFRGKRSVANSNDEVNSKIEVHKQLKAGYEEKFHQAKDLFQSYSSLLNRAHKAITDCKSQIELFMAVMKEHGETDKNQGNLYLEIAGFEKLLKANTLIEEICTTHMNAKAADVDKIQRQIAEVDTAMAELQGKHLDISPFHLRSSRYSLRPLPLPLHYSV